MRLRIAALTELQFLRCLQYGVWGAARTNALKRWKKNDMLAFFVAKKIAGLAEVTSEPYRSEKSVWDNGLFPERVALKFHWVLDPIDRASIEGQVRDALTLAWGKYYGWGILNKVVLPEDAAKRITQLVKSRPDASPAFRKDLQQRIKRAMKESKST